MVPWSHGDTTARANPGVGDADRDAALLRRVREQIVAERTRGLLVRKTASEATASAY
jgi:hypothetical protein